MKDIHFSKNLKYLRKQKGLNQAQILDSIGFKSTTWSGYETGTSYPKFEDFLKISEFFEVSLTDLVEKDLSKGSLITKKNEQKTSKEYSLNPSLTGSLIFDEGVNYGKNEQLGYAIPNVYDFTSPAAAGEAIVILNRDKYRKEPNLFLPDLGPGKHIRVPISGDSMHSTIKDGDKAIATLVSDRNQLHEGYIHLMLDKEEGLICKRPYFAAHGKVELVSDNQIYKPYKRDLKDILFWFRVREVHTSDLRPYWNELRLEMRQIWDEISAIRKSIAQ